MPFCMTISKNGPTRPLFVFFGLFKHRYDEFFLSGTLSQNTLRSSRIHLDYSQAGFELNDDIQLWPLGCFDFIIADF